MGHNGAAIVVTARIGLIFGKRLDGDDYGEDFDDNQ